MQLLYYIWRGYEMSRRTTGTLKGIVIGLLLCAAVMEGCKVYQSMHGSKGRRKRYRLKRDTDKAVHMVGDIFDDLCSCMKR